MEHPIRSLHHVTATSDDAQADLGFCLETLGLRLVKKTVNFDNHHVYHFYYGDETGTPATIWTTFPYKGRGVPVGRKGAGQITVTSFSVPAGSLERWKARLRERALTPVDVEPRFGEERLRVIDPSGLEMHLVPNARDRRLPWSGGEVDEPMAIRGLHSVEIVVHARAKTIDLMTRSLGFAVVNEDKEVTRLALTDEPGKTIDVVEAPDAQPATNGLGTVHHVAMAICDGDEQLRLRRELLGQGLKVTDVRDRCYFQSIYFREPGGVLFEAATIRPGFTIDEELPCLGRELKLPPWEEPHRREIEAGLAKVTHR